MYNLRRSRELSLLARGKGMVEGDVRIDCFSDDTKAFTLSGKPLVRPSDTRTHKPYKAHKLNLPKTFVTKRGQMVLFTAPEDMILGSTCQVHKKEITSQQAARDLKTTCRLLDSALGYSPEDNFHLKHQSSVLPGHKDTYHSDGTEFIVTQPGHFTKVYLKSLQNVSENAKLPSDCSVEDIEEEQEGREEKDLDLLAPCNSEAPQSSECDSGLGHSLAPSLAGRLSAQSRLSEETEGLGFNGTVIIPHGRDENELAMFNEGSAHSDSVPQSGVATEIDALASLKNELAGYKTTTLTNTSTRSSTKPGKKRQRPKSTNQNSADSSKPLKSKSKKSSTEAKSAKSKRKRNRKDANSRSVKHDCNTRDIEGTSMEDDSLVSCNADPEMTAIHLSTNEAWPDEKKLSVSGQGTSQGDGLSSSVRNLSRAEERRAEIERKRSEKRELEAQKKRELEERQRLEDELARAQQVEDDQTPPLDEINEEQPDNVSMASVESDNPMPTISKASDYTLSNQARLRAELERSRLNQQRWMLNIKGEKVEKELDDEISEAQEAIRRAKEAEDERRQLEELRKEKLEEEQRRQQQELEEAARAKAAKILSQKSQKPSSDPNQRLHTELNNQREPKTFSNSSLLFSYFNYVPPPKTKREKKVRGRAVKTKSVKIQ